AAAAAFMTVGAYMIANNLVCRVWGKSCLSLKDENGGVGFLICSLLVFVALLVIVSVGGLSSVFGMEALAYKRLPVTLIPAAVSLLVYEIGGAVIRHRKSNSEK
ncbi:MAG: cation transporting ATPase C-terminal domain-containing protein, partial [Clostridia bacterium]|nr:cation transporting ATPase C-terminal domain-containing protein [Clostridia bacterium]